MDHALPADTVAIFGTLCGATVVLTRDPAVFAGPTHAWECLGCGDTSGADSERLSRRAANSHAAACRSMPLPA